MFEPRVPENRKLNWLRKCIEEFEAQPIVKGKILFYGSSSFTRWCPKWGMPRLEDDILMNDGSQACVNHGFGGSNMEEQLYFYPRAVRPWEPKAMVLTSFGNALPRGYTAAEIFAVSTRILEYARTDFPGIRLFFCNVHPNQHTKTETPGRRATELEFNELVAYYCSKHEDTTLVDQWNYPGFYEEGFAGDPEHIREELFVEDGHQNQEGYKVYREFFMEYLKDLL